MGKGQPFDKWGTSGHPHAKSMDLDPCLTPYTESNSQQIPDLNVSPNTLTFWKTMWGGEGNLCDPELGEDSLDTTPETQPIKTNR